MSQKGSAVRRADVALVTVVSQGFTNVFLWNVRLSVEKIGVQMILHLCKA